jgi:hypothetical protein
MSKERKTFTTRSGEVLQIRPVSQLTISNVLSQLTGGVPLPPVQRVETVDGPRDIPNPNHPDYLAALQNMDVKQAFYIIAVYIQFGVKVNLTEEQLEDVRDLQANNELINPGAPENKFPNYLYVSTICDTMEELQELVQAIQSINTPTEAQVAKHVDAFRVDVTRQTLVANPNASVGDRVPEGGVSIYPLQSGPVGGDEFEEFLREAGSGMAG